MKRAATGLTLIELVAAIALMGFVVAGSGWWIRISTQRATATTLTLRHEAALEAVFAAIAHDLAVGDIATDSEKDPRVQAKPGALAIATRSRKPGVGAVVRQYALRSATGELTAFERPLDPESTGGVTPTASVVLGSVRSFDVTIDERARAITVTVTSLDGSAGTHRWMLP